MQRVYIAGFRPKGMALRILGQKVGHDFALVPTVGKIIIFRKITVACWYKCPLLRAVWSSNEIKTSEVTAKCPLLRYNAQTASCVKWE